MLRKYISLLLLLIPFISNAGVTIPHNGTSGPQLRVEIPRNFFDYKNAKNCEEIKQLDPESSSGKQIVFPQGVFGPGQEVYCDQDTDGGGWTLVASYNQTKDGCLTGFVEDDGYCLKSDRVQNISINTLGIDYQEVRGGIEMRQFASMDGFKRYSATSSIDDIYVDGASITVNDGLGSREHIYTFGIGVYANNYGSQSNCPNMGGTAPPSFVGSDYSCSSGNENVRWGVTHYSPILFSDVEFTKILSAQTNESIEMRVMNDQYLSDEGSSLKSYYFYIR